MFVIHCHDSRNNLIRIYVVECKIQEYPAYYSEDELSFHAYNYGFSSFLRFVLRKNELADRQFGRSEAFYLLGRNHNFQLLISSIPQRDG